MEEEIQKYKELSLRLCNKLMRDISQNMDDTQSFFGGDIYRAYIKANDQAQEKVSYIRNKIRNTK